MTWSPTSWQAKPASQQVTYGDPIELARVLDEIGRLPPLVTSWEVEALREELAKAARGEAFLLQGGDCAESFDDCRSDSITAKLKILLQMSLVLVHGTRKRVIRIGRIAGQYAKPRSTDVETRGDVTLPAYRGDLVNRDAFTAVDRAPDPTLMLRAYERAALTLNFIRALTDGGFADLHHPGVLGRVVREGHAERVASTSALCRIDIRESLDFVQRDHRDRDRGAAPGRRLHQPRGARVALRAGADPRRAAPRRSLQPVDALPVDRHAHRRSSTARTSSFIAGFEIRSGSRSGRR